MTQVADDSLQAGRDAADRHAWHEAYELLSPTASSLAAEDLERLAEAAYWTGRLDEAIELRERAYTAHAAAGDRQRAALLALAISQDYFMKAALAVSGGWFAKAERLLEGEEESPAHGYLTFTRGANRLMAGELEPALGELDRALEMADRYSDRNLQALALVAKGRALVLQGDVEQGLALHDEAAAAATCGELDPFATGFVYCCTITSCHGVGDYRRAAEWTEAANRWCDREAIKGFPGACRVHHASIERLRGNWPAAEEQAVQACDELGGFDAFTTGAGFYEIGEIRRRRGDFAAAEEAYRKAKDWGRDPQPGLALLRLAQGKVEAAAAAMKRAMASVEDPIARLRRLPAQVEIALEAGDLKTARTAAEELEELVDRFRVGSERMPAFDATVSLAWGQIRVKENDVEGAVEKLEHAVQTWRAVGAPFEVAEAQMLLGLALRRLGDEEGARDELTAAKAAFERLGAALLAERTGELLGDRPLRRTFVFTDVVDSTKLVEALGEDKWKKLLGWHDRTLRELIEAEGGEVIKQTGDGYFAAFQSPVAALEASVAIQRALDEHEPFAPDVRIGVHTGGAFHVDEAADYAGQGVHMAARIGALAGAGEILVSRESLDGASKFRLADARTEALKGFDEPVELVAVEWR
jgi:class 3 adenylate cyclase